MERAATISVIVPVLDEEARLGRRLAELAATPGLGEVLVVDGGSADSTVAIAHTFSGVRLLSAARGRARQMNAGAAAAVGDVFLFLHADVSLPRDAAAWIVRTLADPRVVAGAFRTWTVPDGAPSRLGPLLRLADIRSRVARFPYGDQAIFVRRDAFARAGGFPPPTAARADRHRSRRRPRVRPAVRRTADPLHADRTDLPHSLPPRRAAARARPLLGRRALRGLPLESARG